jgi:hypothetical protein
MRLLGFDQNRQSGESRVVEQPPERLDAEAAFSNVLMTIHTAAARSLRVVAV